jgi:thiol-disulfide isomerase/thioredoxin
MKNIALLLTFIACIFVMPIQVQAQKRLPAFSFQDLNGAAFTNANLKSGIPTIVFFYDPYCDHCAQEADWVKAAQSKFANINLLWVSTEERQPIVKFKSEHFGETTLTKLYFLRDTKWKFDSYFGYTEAPGIYVYNKDGVLVKDFKKETPVSELLRPLGLQ